MSTYVHNLTEANTNANARLPSNCSSNPVEELANIKKRLALLQKQARSELSPLHIIKKGRVNIASSYCEQFTGTPIHSGGRYFTHNNNDKISRSEVTAGSWRKQHIQLSEIISGSGSGSGSCSVSSPRSKSKPVPRSRPTMLLRARPGLELREPRYHADLEQKWRTPEDPSMLVQPATCVAHKSIHVLRAIRRQVRDSTLNKMSEHRAGALREKHEYTPEHDEQRNRLRPYFKYCGMCEEKNNHYLTRLYDDKVNFSSNVYWRKILQDEIKHF